MLLTLTRKTNNNTQSEFSYVLKFTQLQNSKLVLHYLTERYIATSIEAVLLCYIFLNEKCYVAARFYRAGLLPIRTAVQAVRRFTA